MVTRGYLDTDKKSARLFFDSLTGYYDLSRAVVLDMFARRGELTVASYAPKVGHVDAWEINPDHAEALKRLGCTVTIGCAYKLARRCAGGYDMVVIDSPQGLHPDALAGVDRVEHFYALEASAPLLNSSAVVVLYVNRRPYNAEEVGHYGMERYAGYSFKQWMKARQEFYGAAIPSFGQAIDTYRELYLALGFDLAQIFVTPCYSDVPGREPYAFRLGLELRRK